MNEARIHRAERSLNGMAAKVLNAVPIQEPWSKAQIVAEMRRVGSNCEVNVVEGCLNTLRGHGLVKEPERGMFVRVQARLVALAPVPTKPTHEEKTMPAQQAAPITVKPDPLESMAALAATAKTLAQSVAELARRIEDVALEVADANQRLQSDTEKLRQLQALLKSI